MFSKISRFFLQCTTALQFDNFFYQVLHKNTRFLQPFEKFRQITACHIKNSLMKHLILYTSHELFTTGITIAQGHSKSKTLYLVAFTTQHCVPIEQKWLRKMLKNDFEPRTWRSEVCTLEIPAIFFLGSGLQEHSAWKC